MKNLNKAIQENQEKLSQLGLSLKDLQPELFGYFINHANTIDNNFALEKLELAQAIFLLKFIDTIDNSNSSLRGSLLYKIKNEVTINQQFSVIQNDEDIQEKLVASFIEDSELLLNYLLQMTKNGVDIKAKDIFIDLKPILLASVFLAFNTNKKVRQLKSEINFIIKNNKKFNIEFRREFNLLTIQDQQIFEEFI